MRKDTLHLLFFFNRSFTGSSGRLYFWKLFSKTRKPQWRRIKEEAFDGFFRSTYLLSGYARVFWSSPLSHWYWNGRLTVQLYYGKKTVL